MTYQLLIEAIERQVHLDEIEIDNIRAAFQPQYLKRREVLIHQGDVCRYEYFVNSGCLRSFYTVKDTQHTLMFATEGWWTGSLKSFLKSIPSAITIEAMESTHLLRISRPQLEALYDHVPKLDRFFRLLLQNRLMATQDRVLDHLTLPATERYAQFLQQYPTLGQRVAQKYIASYLGISPAFLSRLRRPPTDLLT
ncbi:Crp/Fnr family transcriptional regulator [uncultured Fibrella sp.]|uniref:Crp/Fnr family transcriptional regulator n=1 Tax=uncultured Fibrella sp. TaxID=1284596 RepID=UPI0035C9D467